MSRLGHPEKVEGPGVGERRGVPMENLWCVRGQEKLGPGDRGP